MYSTPAALSSSGVRGDSFSPGPIQPRAGRPRERPNPFEGGVDDLFLVVLRHGALEPAVTLKLPARLEHGLGHVRIRVDDVGVDAGDGPHAPLLQHADETGKATAHPVFHPGVVDEVGDRVEAVGIGEYLPGYRLVVAENLDRHHDLHDQRLAVGRRKTAPLRSVLKTNARIDHSTGSSSLYRISWIS